MVNKVKTARIGLLVYSLLGIIAVGVSYITDFVNNDAITWSIYVMSAVSMLFLSILPLCFAFKYRRLASLAVLSGAALTLLYLLDTLSPGDTRFRALAFPIALQVLASLWISGLVLRFFRFSRWYLFAALLAGFGGALVFSISRRLDDVIQKGASPLINIVGIFTVAVVAAGLCVGGYVQRSFRERKQNAHREMELEAEKPVNGVGTDLLAHTPKM